MFTTLHDNQEQASIHILYGKGVGYFNPGLAQAIRLVQAKLCFVAKKRL